jgi:hypothetical protein
MSQLSRGIFGALAVTLTFGAVQLASGRDLAGVVRGPSEATNSSGLAEATINRAAKADRGGAAAAQVAQTRTISLRLDSLSETSILVRVPAVREIDRHARNGASAPSLMKTGGKPTVACEPVVSVLTEVAKQLQPGRCVT